MFTPGDVYAFEPNSWIGSQIANTTDGPYSHVGIELVGGRFLEAVPGAGVQIVDLNTRINGRDYDIYRSDSITTDAIPSLESFASFVEGLPYDNSAIAGFPTLNGCEYVCSTLVADISSYSGLGNISGNASNILFDYSTPNDIITNDSYQLICSSFLPNTIPAPPISSGASGGFVLYPNRPNTNQMQGVYAK